MGYCRFKIVADGLVFTKTSYAKVVPSETSMLEFLAGNYTLSDAEKRKRLKLKSYPLEELPFIYRTQKFMLWKTRRIIEVAEYLLQVLRLAEKIVIKIQQKETDNDVEKYIDILLEIAADKDDILSSRLCHGLQDAYIKLIQSIPKILQAKVVTAEG